MRSYVLASGLLNVPSNTGDSITICPGCGSVVSAFKYSANDNAICPPAESPITISCSLLSTLAACLS